MKIKQINIKISLEDVRVEYHYFLSKKNGKRTGKIKEKKVYFRQYLYITKKNIILKEKGTGKEDIISFSDFYISQFVVNGKNQIEKEKIEDIKIDDYVVLILFSKKIIL